MSKGITDATVEEIKARVDLADLISSYGIEVKVAGASKKACCPFHHEKTPSFNINDTKGYYHCFGCGESGDAIKFVQKYEGLTFVEAVRKLAEQLGIKIEEREDPEAGRRSRLLALLAELAAFYRRCLLKTKEAEVARAYLADRELDEKIGEDYLIGYAPTGIAPILKWAEKYGYTSEELELAGVIKGPTRPGDLGYHRFGGRLMFTIRDKRGRVVGFSGRQLVASKNSGKYVNSPETAVFKKSNVLYGFDKAAVAMTRDPNHEAIVCEGQIDCIRLQTRGFPNSVAGQGTAFTEEHVKMLKKAADQVALVYDDDAAGHKATIKSARLCLAAELPVRVVSLPNGDDPDSYLRVHPSDDFRTMLEGAQSIVAFQLRVERAKERNPESVDAVNRVSKEILQTVSVCPGAILRATMLDEAAKLLGLPRAALTEELEKVRTERSVVPVRRPEPTVEPREGTDGFSEEDEFAEPLDDEPLIGESAARVLPPPKTELAFCAYLLSIEEDVSVSEILGLIDEFLPDYVYSSQFTRDFITAWRMRIVSGEDTVVVWRETLTSPESEWFDQLLLDLSKDLASAVRATDRIREWVSTLWAEHLRREQGALPAVGDVETENRRLKLSLDIYNLNKVKWSSVKNLIRDWIKNNGSEGSY